MYNRDTGEIPPWEREEVVTAVLLRLLRLAPEWVVRCAVFVMKRKYVLGAVAIVVNDRGEFLFLHHTYRRRYAWRLPGGLVERRENPLETVVRELQEEARMTVRPIAVVAVHPADVTLDIGILCELVQADEFQVNAEVDALTWVVPEQAPFAIKSEQWEFIRAARALRGGETDQLGAMSCKPTT
ncbi:MAG: NUDIX hydrolase [Firmicutes bacterium]|nr:NUDIX hydrolase [Bacillota bacterium]